MSRVYGNKGHDFNGIWRWLQDNGFTKVTRTNDPSYGFTINCMREFMTANSIRIIRTNGKFNVFRNSIAVQDRFQEFTALMLNKKS